MNEAPLNVALVGCGRIAGHHCRAIRATEGLRLAALCDLKPEAAQQWIEGDDIPVFTSYHEMLTTLPEIDIVAVITPSGMHFEHGAEILEGYGKHLILEKPTVLRFSDLNRLDEMARARSLRLFPVYQNRYNKAVVRTRQAIEAGELGEPRIITVRVRWCRPQRYYDLAPWRGTYALDGGALTNQGIHHMDLLRHLGGEVKRVNAQMRTLGAEIEVEDTAVAVIEFESGAVGTVEVTTSARPLDFEASVSVVGSEGLAQIGGIAVNELQIFTPDPDACAANSEDFSDCVYGNGHYRLYEDLAADLNGGAPYPMSVDETAKTLALLHAFYVSDEKGDWVAPGEESVRLGRTGDPVADLYRTPAPGAEKRKASE